jgi:hypothetical protein
LSDIVRVLRIVEYIGPREWVEKTIARSIHGTRFCDKYNGFESKISAATIGEFPEILELESAKYAQRDESLNPEGNQETGNESEETIQD